MSDGEPEFVRACSSNLRRQVEPWIREFAKQILAGTSPRIEEYLPRVPADAQALLMYELLREEIAATGASLELTRPADYLKRFPQLADVIHAAFPVGNFSSPTEPENGTSEGGASPEPTPAASHPESFGRYRIIRRIGRGGFGTVYLAHDPQLDRQVALKVPRQDRFADAAACEPFANEARTTAKLGGHPGIVTLHDVFVEHQTPVLVQEFIEGTNFRDLLKAAPNGLSVATVLELMTKVVEAVAYAHQKGFYHRDLKPENLLLDDRQHPRIADFGLAIHDDQRKLGHHDPSGSPHYMSPERVRGESHRIDARSDIWSLGVVLYELLAAKRPFLGDSAADLAESICCREPTTLRQLRPETPHELERIVGRCLEKRQSDRYSSAIDLLSDLVHCREVLEVDANGYSCEPIGRNPLAPSHRPVGTALSTTAAAVENLLSAGLPVIPKGLRSFDREDAYFFPALLPGPRDRMGLPESIRFWKLRLESLEAHRAFPVGVLYGPSGSGKSSLLKSGVIPLLPHYVRVVYLDAYDRPLITSLDQSLRGLIQDPKVEISLPDLMLQIRNMFQKRSNSKVVLILDQIEQWLHDSDETSWRLLTETLRQCDGHSLQALIVVRDDFWIPLTRLLHKVEVPLVEGENLAAMDLFSTAHAERVLEWLGRAYGAFPLQGETPLNEDQRSFVRESVKRLAEDGRVVSVRLSLFALMMSDRPWTLGELKTIGGLSGLGVKYLEDTFCGQQSHPENEAHMQAARAVLQHLLPDRLSTIRGAKKSREELLLASGYENRPAEFQSLIALLDRRLKLITPSEPLRAEMEQHGPDAPDSQSGSSFSIGSSYQLTHDYLVPSLREWCTIKQQETARGRAGILLRERASMWKERQEPRFLPTFLEWLMVHRWTPPSLWTQEERQLMQQSNRFYGTRSAVVLTLSFAMVASIALAIRGYTRTTQIMVDRLMEADPTHIQQAVALIAAAPNRFAGSLRKQLQLTAGSPLEARVRLALLSGDPLQAPPLAHRILDADVREIPILIDALMPFADSIADQWWKAMRDGDSRKMMVAAAGLARIAPESPKWGTFADRVALNLISMGQLERSQWEEMLHPASHHWLPHALDLLRSSGPGTKKAWLAASQLVLAHAGHDLNTLVEVLLEGHPQVFHAAFFRCDSLGPQALDQLAKVWNMIPMESDEAGADASTRQKARQYVAGLAYLQMNPKLAIEILPDDPQHLDSVALLATYTEGRFARPEAFFRALEHFSNAVIPREENARVRHDLQLYALLLALGELPLEHVPQSQDHNVIQQLVSIYRHHPSRSVHSATGWLLRRWGRTEQVQAIDSHPLPYDPTGWRQWYVLEIDPKKMQGLPDIVDDSPSGSLEPIDLESPFHITMIAFYPPSTNHSNQSHQPTLGQPFAISDREVPWRWFSPVDGDTRRREILGLQNFRNRSPLAPDEPVVRTNWMEATDCLHWFSRGAGFRQQKPSHADSRPATTQPGSAEESGLRLPTLTEWQIASNASHYRFGHGNDETLLHRYSWFRENAGNIWHPVAQLRPNANGLFDMDGNVSEWLDDPFSTERENGGRESQESTFPGPRCFRGGHWDSPASLCDNQSVATEKFGAIPMERNSLRGFRVAQTLQTNGQGASSLRLDSSLSQTNP